MESLTEEQKALVEQYQYVPIWLTVKRLGREHAVVRHAVMRVAGFDDLLAELHIAVIKGVLSYNPDRGRGLKGWIILLCVQHLFALARPNKKVLFKSKVFSGSTEKELYVEPPKPGLSDIVDVPLHVLSEKQKTVLDYRFTHSMTLQQIGDKMGYTKERIRQIQDKALDRLKLYILKDLE